MWPVAELRLCVCARLCVCVCVRVSPQDPVEQRLAREVFTTLTGLLSLVFKVSHADR